MSRVPRLEDIAGHEEAKRALEVAAAGGHPILLVGAPGIGKTLLARALVGLLPPRDGKGRPLCVPRTDKDLSEALGEVRAGQGLLVLDPVTRFQDSQAVASALDEQRMSREEGCLVVATLEPCLCGQILQGNCRCTLAERKTFTEGLPWELLVRIPIWQTLTTPSVGELANPVEHRTENARVAAIRRARKAVAERYAGAVPVNGRLAYGEIRRWQPASATQDLASKWSQQRRPSTRDWVEVWSLARTVADLEPCEEIRAPHLTEAVEMHRTGTSAGRAAGLLEPVEVASTETEPDERHGIGSLGREFGQLLVRLRRAKGVTRAGLAGPARVSEVQIGKIERGEIQQPQTKTVARLLRLVKADRRHVLAVIRRLAELESEAQALVQGVLTGRWTEREARLLGGFADGR